MGAGLRSQFQGASISLPMVKLSGGGVTKDEYGITIVDLNNLGYRDEPFVLAQDVAQVFYIKDMSSKPKKGINKQKDEPKRHIILKEKLKETKTNITLGGNEGKRAPFVPGGRSTRD